MNAWRLTSFLFCTLRSFVERNTLNVGYVSNDVVFRHFADYDMYLTFKERYFSHMCLGARGEERHATYDDGRMRGGHANWSHRHLRSNSIEEASSSECVSDFAIPILLPSSHPPTT